MTIALSAWWLVGWIAGVVVVAIAAALLIVLILLGRRIAGQAQDITTALDGAQSNSSRLFDVTAVNLDLDRLKRALHALRTGGE